MERERVREREKEGDICIYPNMPLKIGLFRLSGSAMRNILIKLPQIL